MAQLSALPNELLRHILSNFMPEDIENFAQASKHIRSISGPALKEHRRLIRKYTSFSGPAAADTVEPLLKDVLANPRIGYYVKEINLCRVREGDAESQDEGGQESEEEGEQESEVEGEQKNGVEDGSVEERIDKSEGDASLDYIHAAIDESKLLRPRSLQRFHKNVDNGEKNILLALLLPLLPNLRVLSLADAGYLQNLYKVMKRAPKLDEPFLPKLEHVHIQAYDHECYREHLLLDSLANFLPLPSLRRLTGVGAAQDGWRRELLEPLQITNITHLELRDCNIGSKFLDRFLRNFPYLQSFVYTSFYEGYTEYEFDPFIIRAALQATVSTTLRKLTILTDAIEDRKEFMGPLCGFKVLEHVYSEWCCLIPDVRANVRGDDREILSMILPVSLKVLNVRDHDSCYSSDHEELIGHAIQAKTGPDAPLPLLETLAVTMASENAAGARKQLQDETYKKLQQRCDEVRLSLHFNVEDST